jgi:hypothetical protein
MSSISDGRPQRRSNRYLRKIRYQYYNRRGAVAKDIHWGKPVWSGRKRVDTNVTAGREPCEPQFLPCFSADFLRLSTAITSPDPRIGKASADSRRSWS